MNNNSTKNKKIAKNTLFLYLRTLFTMLISLYTSRIVLEKLGISDYGIYNVVGGISSSFVFLSSALSNATHRYLNYEIGRGNQTKLNQIFNLNFIIYFTYAIISILIIDSGGLWLVNNKLTIPLERLAAAKWILHSTSISLFFTILCSVYESVLISRENMKIYAYIGMFDAIIKLIIAFSLTLVSVDKLKLYAILLLLATLISKSILIIYAIKNYTETKLKFFWNRKIFIEMFSFSGWNLLDASIFLLNDQGINLLLNIFFGPAINAARGVSLQIKSAITNFSSGFLLAMRPQIVKSYASEDIEYFKSLIYNCGKFTFFLLWIICLPVILRVSDILAIWLKDVPEMATHFVIWMLIFSLINSLCDPFWQGIQAVGILKKYVLIGNSIYFLAFPLSYIAFKLGASSVATYQIIAMIRLIYLFAVFYIFKQYVTIKLHEYSRLVLYPIIKVVLVSTMISVPINNIIPSEHFIFTLASCICVFLISVISIWTVGIDKDERKLIYNNIISKLCPR